MAKICRLVHPILKCTFSPRESNVSCCRGTAGTIKHYAKCIYAAVRTLARVAQVTTAGLAQEVT
jgi:hypothetical protein